MRHVTDTNYRKGSLCPNKKKSCITKKCIIYIYIYIKNRRFSCVQANFGAKFIGSAGQLFRPYWVSSATHTCSTRSGTDELNLMTMKGHQIRSNSAYGAEHKVAVHNKKSKNGKFPFTTFGGTVKSNYIYI